MLSSQGWQYAQRTCTPTRRAPFLTLAAWILPPFIPCSSDKSAIFLLDDFDLFAAKRSKQTLLYNLLDALQTSGMQVCSDGVGLGSTGLVGAVLFNLLGALQTSSMQVYSGGVGGVVGLGSAGEYRAGITCWEQQGWWLLYDLLDCSTQTSGMQARAGGCPAIQPRPLPSVATRSGPRLLTLTARRRSWG